MRRTVPLFIFSQLLFSGGAFASEFTTVWQLGEDDASLSPFSQESFGPNNSPGSAITKDDDYYLAGAYPAPIGTLVTDEPVSNFERAVTSGDPRNRIHFHLTSPQVSSTSELRITVDLTGGGAWINGSIPGFSSHDITIRLNGNVIATRSGLTWNTTITTTNPASSIGAVAGENVLQIERTGGAAGGYVGIDYVKLEVDTLALQDLDGDGMPLWFELTFGLDDSNAGDASLDADGDGLNNLEEFQAGTNPTDPDSDNDGLSDSAETSTNPLSADTDGDGLPDGDETISSPIMADTDADGFPDNYEVEQHSDPANPLDKPFNYPGAIGLQFISEQQGSAALGAWDTAGFFRFPQWNVSPALPSWVGSGTVLNGTSSSLKDHRGQSTGASASWTCHFASEGLHKGPGDERLLNGMIRTERNASVNTPATVNLTGIPYASYDIIVYPGYIYPTRRGVIRLDGDPTTLRYFATDSSPPFVGWREITATSLAEIQSGNYVRFRNLTGSSHSVTLESVDNEAIGIHGLQIVESGTDSDGDGVKDIAEIEWGFNPSVADSSADNDGDGLSNLDELNAGTDPNNSDSDQDGVPDGNEGAYGTSPLDPDSDDDGLTDGEEIHGQPFPSLPTLADSDGDGFGDPTELAHSSDPSSAGSTPPPVPIWDAATRSWRWRIDNLRVLWNHNQSMLGAIESDESMLCEAVADINQSGWNRQIAIGIRYIGGKLVHRFRCVEGAFYQNGSSNSGFWDSDWSSNPTDRSRDLGLSGYGVADDSKPLRFEFTAVQSNPGINLWTLNFLISDLSNPAAPAVIASHTWNNAVAADASLLAGTTLWKNQRGEADEIDIHTETGVSCSVSMVPPGTPDADNDGMPDEWESEHSFNASDPADAPLDADNDGLNNLREFLAGTDPRNSDSDGDSAPDGEEVCHGTNPLDSASLPPWFAHIGAIDDLDGDGLSDAWVLWAGGKPRSASADDDGDGLTNREECIAGTDPDDGDSRLDLLSWRDAGDLVLSWPDLADKRSHVESSAYLGLWQPVGGLPPSDSAAGRRQQRIAGVFPSAGDSRFYRVGVGPVDSDGDGVEDWIEKQVLGSDVSRSDSMGQPLVQTGGKSLSGDAVALLNRMQGSSPAGGTPGTSVASVPSPVQASRFLMQASFGPTSEAIEEVRDLGYEGWINRQITLTPSLLQPYIRRIKADGAGPRIDSTYNFNELDQFVHGNNVTTPFARIAVGGADQLRQRMAFALSQILVVSRRDAQLEEKPEAMANYYDLLVRHALGNYGDLLRDVTFHPAMGWYLSSAGNQKADPVIPRYPDENYAREIMQLFTIGLWKLHPDGSRKLDVHGEPIPTYDNGDITELARVFTGMYFASPYGWGGGGWADEHYTLPMVMYADRHDFGSKHLPNGFVVPSRTATDANGIQDIRDAVDALFRHPNTPPFVCRQLIQFLVTDNPTPGYIRRVQDVFVNDGSGARGNLAAVAKAILLDPEARNQPLSPSFGKVREPVIRTMHLGRLLRLAEVRPDFVWWNWTDNYYAFCLQEPMNSPSVFNFYTPVYQAPGGIRESGLVSPGFQIINTYSAVSFPNLMWEYLHEGFKSGWSWEFPLDYRDALMLADNPAALVDQIDLLVCAGNLTARTRSILLNTLADPDLTPKDRVALAIWTAMNSPEGVVQR